MTRIYLVRHGRAAAGWDTDPDPPLDKLGQHQAQTMAATLESSGPLALVSSPMLRCRQTAAALGARWGVETVIEPAVTEIPSPERIAMADRVDWLRRAMVGTWGDLDARYHTYRDSVVAAVSACERDTVVASHFVAINAVIGAALADDRLVIRSLDNCSITVIDVVNSELVLIEGGSEADTLIR
jgi:broad specificity phosphatase PhoE